MRSRGPTKLLIFSKKKYRLLLRHLSRCLLNYCSEFDSYIVSATSENKRQNNSTRDFAKSRMTKRKSLGVKSLLLVKDQGTWIKREKVKRMASGG